MVSRTTLEVKDNFSYTASTLVAGSEGVPDLLADRGESPRRGSFGFFTFQAAPVFGRILFSGGKLISSVGFVSGLWNKQKKQYHIILLGSKVL